MRSLETAHTSGYLASGREYVPLWAPEAKSVTLVVQNQADQPMRRDGSWWFAPEPLPDGTNYAFSIDGAKAIPDPRARFFPAGPHAWSQTYTPRADGRTKDVLGTVFYELHVGAFTREGTLDAAALKLDYLKDLGVQTIELMPLASFEGNRGWGYDGVGIYATHAAYGGPAALARFIRAAHNRQMRVCVDLVLNHMGPLGNYLGAFGPYFTDRHITPWGDGFDLDGPDSAAVRDFLIGAALNLLDGFGVDALRLDAVHEIQDGSAKHLLAELSDTVNQLSNQRQRVMTLIAESDLNDVKMLRPTVRGGYGLDGQWNDDIHHALHVEFTGETQGYYADFADPRALDQVYRGVFYHDGCYSTFRERPWGAPVADHYHRRRFLAYSSNHDQVGNRAVGDRPQLALSEGENAAMAAMVLLSPFTPMLFMGEEFNATTPFQFFTDFPADFGRAVSAGRLAEFAAHGWDSDTVPDPQNFETARASILNWAEAEAPAGKKMREWYQALIRLRQDKPASTARVLRHGKSLVLVTDAYTVWVNRGEFTLVADRVELAEYSGSSFSLDEQAWAGPDTPGPLTTDVATLQSQWFNNAARDVICSWGQECIITGAASRLEP